MNIEVTRTEVENAIYNFEKDRRAGQNGHGNGHWMYLRAYKKSGGVIIVSGMEVSPRYPATEHFGDGEYPPITFYSCQEYFSPRPGGSSVGREDIDYLVEEAMEMIKENWNP